MQRQEAIIEEQIALMNIPMEKRTQRSAAYACLGGLYRAEGMLNESIAAYLQALSLDQANNTHWEAFVETIKFAEFSHPHEGIRQTVIAAFTQPSVTPQHLAIPALSLLKMHPLYGTENPNFLSDPLLLLLLEKAIVPDESFELWMTKTRRDILLKNISVPQEFIASLTKQCYLTEYVYTESEEEMRLIEQEKGKQPELEPILDCYRPASQQEEKKQELALAEQIPAIAPVTGHVSKLVQEQYEEHPYPRWSRIGNTSPKDLSTILHTLFPLQPLPNTLPSHPEVLIAGCGTGRQAIAAATKYAKSSVLGVDLSRRSLAYALRKARELGINNLSFMQGDLLDIGKLRRTFDLIECSGVLHHLEDPVKGWKALKDVLKPDGIMAIGLYSETARQDVVRARAMIQEEGYRPTLEGIRQCRQALRKHPEFQELSRSLDFYTISSCRDLLFHVQEHRFTLPQIASIIGGLGLELIGLELPAPTILNTYLSKYPGDPRAISLTNWDLFEQANPATFIGMYHLWLRKQ